MFELGVHPEDARIEAVRAATRDKSRVSIVGPDVIKSVWNEGLKEAEDLESKRKKTHNNARKMPAGIGKGYAER